MLDFGLFAFFLCPVFLRLFCSLNFGIPPSLPWTIQKDSLSCPIVLQRDISTPNTGFLECVQLWCNRAGLNGNPGGFSRSADFWVPSESRELWLQCAPPPGKLSSFPATLDRCQVGGGYKLFQWFYCFFLQKVVMHERDFCFGKIQVFSQNNFFAKFDKKWLLSGWEVLPLGCDSLTNSVQH